ncbi:MAG TPA: DUF5615 family PIN-like protein [Candidatus Methanofastidiosum sp.]|jgi:predicted nuclease of predicted toxin-antitoxin system|nr:DUF5615 family PIN-like protein [Methanofastidiosum sp.]
MKFIVDECTGPKVARWLRSLNHEVLSVHDEAKGADDETIIDKANRENFILITNDKDFGELIFKFNREHKGVILLRLKNERPENKIYVLSQLLESYSEKLANNFIVVTEKNVKIIEIEK